MLAAGPYVGMVIVLVSLNFVEYKVKDSPLIIIYPGSGGCTFWGSNCHFQVCFPFKWGLICIGKNLLP